MVGWKLLGAPAFLIMLAACGPQQPAQQVPPVQPAAVVEPAALATTVADTTTLAVDTARATIEPYVQTKTVAPGIQIVITGLPVAVGISDPSEQRLVLSVRAQGRDIYRDTIGDGVAFDYYSEPQSAKIYPLWVPAGPGAGQLLVARSNRPNKDLVQRFTIVAGRLARLDTLPAFDGPARDLDHDGRLEYGGSYAYSEMTDDGHGHLGATYDLARYYEVRPSGLVLDSALTKARAIKRFRSFHEYAPQPEFVPPRQPGAEKIPDE